MRKLSLATLTVGALLAMVASPQQAHAGMEPQGMEPQGMEPQGMALRASHPQDIHLSSIGLNDFTLGGLPIQYMTLVGSELRGWVYDNRWRHLTYTNMVSARTTATLHVAGQRDSALELSILDVAVDHEHNTMEAGWPGQPDYYENDDVILYTLLYRKAGSRDPWNYLCGGDRKGMFFAGIWNDNTHAWAPSKTHFTFSCNSGVLAKCARNWGYKPWRSDLPNAYGHTQDLGDLHQVCVRAAKADYMGNGHSYTVTGTIIDMFDNSGYNVPATSTELSSLGFSWGVEFEAFFSDSTNYDKPFYDYWAPWMNQARYDEWSDLGELEHIKTNLNLTVSLALLSLDSTYSQGKTEIAVFQPIWSALGDRVASGSTDDSFDHFTSSCATATAPDRAHRWTAPTSGFYDFTTAGSSYDTVLAIYRGRTELACNNDTALGLQSSITYYVPAGTTITIVIDGNTSRGGDYVLNVKRRPYR